MQIVGPNPINPFKAFLLCEQLRHLQRDMYGSRLDGKDWHQRHSVRFSGMRDLSKLRGLLSLTVTRFADEEEELEYFERFERL